MPEITLPPVSDYVQKMIAGTNGRMYVDRIGNLASYPIPEIPVPEKRGGLFLDIGCGWGRWMVAAADKGYTPIGVDIRLESAQATQEVLRAHGVKGHVVLADLQRLPFRADLFDTVWSFSVIQHAHREKAKSCATEIQRVLKPGSQTVLEFPMKFGIWNFLNRLRLHQDESDFESWCVRYYTIPELRKLMGHFQNFRFWSHCYFGIGTQPIDLQYVPKRFHPFIRASLFLTAVSEWVTPLRWVADSLYVSAKKPMRPGWSNPDTPKDFYSMLICPETGEKLRYEAEKNQLVSESGRTYAVLDGIPDLRKATSHISETRS
jgi:ubiquinone/menaquinone biosynthesis C-methylase UbiE/uncharacterized protein YbaR (Trm112 family)